MIEKQSISYFILFVVYRLLLDFLYVTYIHPLYDYTGMHMEYNMNTYVLSWCVLVGLYPLFYLNIKKDTFLGLSIYMLGILSFIPTTTLMGLWGVEIYFFVLMTIYWFFILACATFFKPFKWFKVSYKQSRKQIWFWLVFSSMVIIYISGKYTGFRFHFNLIDVYDIRFEAREFGLPILLSYIHNAINTILPVLFVLFLSQRNYKVALFIAFIIFLNFGIAGHKSVIFTLFLAVLAYYLFSFKKKILLLVGMISIIFVSVLEPVFLNSNIFLSVFVNRLLFIPAKLHLSFYEFFKNNELLFFRQGPLRWLGIDSPYSLPIEFIVGGQETGNHEVRANNGLFTDAYMNLGNISVLIFPFIIIFILKLLDASARGIDERLHFLPVYVTVSVLISTTFTTALLNNGLFLLIFFLSIIPKQSREFK